MMSTSTAHQLIPSGASSRIRRLSGTAHNYYRQHGSKVPDEIATLIKNHERLRVSPTALAETLFEHAPNADPLQVAHALLNKKFPDKSVAHNHLVKLFGQARVVEFTKRLPNPTSTAELERQTALKTLFDPIASAHPPTASMFYALSAPTSTNAKGFPIITEDAYRIFLRDVPHLFASANVRLELLGHIENRLGETGLDADSTASIQRAIDVLRTVTLTAAVTAPPDLWLMRQILDDYQSLGITDAWLVGGPISPDLLHHRHGLNRELVNWDLAFLHTRGWLFRKGAYYMLNPEVKSALADLKPLVPEECDVHQVTHLADWFSGAAVNVDLAYRLHDFLTPPDDGVQASGWIPGSRELELGFRVVPCVLALRKLQLTSKLTAGISFKSVVPHAPRPLLDLFFTAGLMDANMRVTELGARVFERGPGPFGIIHAYNTYMRHHRDRLIGQEYKAWVARGENVAASQDANRKSFKDINDALDQFCKDTGFSYDIFIEHAVGQGEATRQRLERSGEGNIRYIAADLEDASIDRAEAAQLAGELPKNMTFVRNADIGKPEILIDALATMKVPTQDAVMVVGNGFHEVRGQTNEKMIETFAGYRQAGIVLAFTEEIGLADDDLIATGWNTYNAGFRYVHDISGQGLRPAFRDPNNPNARLSWAECAEKAGYVVLEKYTRRARTIYPHPRAGGYNPSISVSYFCVPRELAERLGLI